jgi:hypothetical protein
MRVSASILAVAIVISASIISSTVLEVKKLERVVTVKGLAEREVKADVAIFPINFGQNGDDLNGLISDIKYKNSIIVDFLIDRGFSKDEIDISLPQITDKKQYSYDSKKLPFRYTVNSTVNIYTDKVDLVISTRKKLELLSEYGIFVSEGWVQYLFRGLNSIKPSMIEDATKNGREVAEKFAKDSGSTLGKIREARQGQFSISDRDSNTPYLKRVRVVSTVVYYLND